MRGRLSGWWIAVGAIAIIGAYLLAVRTLFATGTTIGWLGYVAHVIGAMAGGAAMCACAPLRPSREPVVAGVVAIAAMALAFVAVPHVSFSWIGARASSPAVAIAGIAFLSAGSAFAGAWVTRQLRATIASTPAIASLSTLVTIGTLFLIVNTIGLGSSANGDGLRLLLVLGALVAVGFLVQAAIATRRPWTCASGAIGLFGWAIAAQDLSVGRALGYGAFAVVFFTPVAYAGARIGWRLVASRRPEAQATADVPAARTL